MAVEIDWWSSDNIVWAGIAGLVGWLVRTERRFGKVMTREEHERICMTRNDALGKTLADIKTSMERGEERRDKMFEQLSGMRVDIATLKERSTHAPSEG